ncbi:MAG TPA: hypothetical protein PKA64_25075 [Myxococcota bacterium]|nr:hypothetical protein [Myxococcota bacterium]
MDSHAYKSRAWWALRALAYAADIVDLEDAREAGRGRPGDLDQILVWARELRACMAAAGAPAEDERLTPIYVDRRGELLAQHRAA